MNRTVAIIGAGFSGAMLAVRLAEAGATAILIEKSGEFGRGVAYGTTDDAHVLNVRAGRMSARADAPDHFVQWLANRHPGLADPQGFVPRRVYGDYLQQILDDAASEAPGSIVRVPEAAAAVTADGVRLADGGLIAADAVVLATGNPPPAAAFAPAGPAVIADPWASGALDGVQPSDRLLIIGAGLTMIDMILTLEARGWGGRAAVISRHGLLPRAHGPAHEPVEARPPAPGPLSARLREFRRAGEIEGWERMMDRLRPLNARIWADLPVEERARFLRHLRPIWDVHRHRIAPEPAECIARLIREGRLSVSAGHIHRVRTGPAGVSVDWTRRGGTREGNSTAEWLIDCTGPGYNRAIRTDGLLRGLLEEGRARLDALALGLDVAADGGVIDTRGEVSNRLFALGPPARAAFWECTAVPDIRERIEDLATKLLS